MKKAIHAHSLRVVSVGDGAATALHVIPTKGEEFVLTMSGEGLAQLGEAIRVFLEQHPEFQGQKSPPRH